MHDSRDPVTVRDGVDRSRDPRCQRLLGVARPSSPTHVGVRVHHRPSRMRPPRAASEPPPAPLRPVPADADADPPFAPMVATSPRVRPTSRSLPPMPDVEPILEQAADGALEKDWDAALEALQEGALPRRSARDDDDAGVALRVDRRGEARAGQEARGRDELREGARHQSEAPALDRRPHRRSRRDAKDWARVVTLPPTPRRRARRRRREGGRAVRRRRRARRSRLGELEKAARDARDCATCIAPDDIGILMQARATLHRDARVAEAHRRARRSRAHLERPAPSRLVPLRAGRRRARTPARRAARPRVPRDGARRRPAVRSRALGAHRRAHAA